MMLFVGVPFTVIAVRGRAFLQASAAQLYVAVGALIVSAIVATEWPLVLWVLVIALETMIIAGRPSHQAAHRATRPRGNSLDGLRVAMWDLNRQDRPDAGITVGIDHYSVHGAYRLACLGW